MIDKLICSVVGHRPAFGYGHQEGKGYFSTKFVAVDGTTRIHASLHCSCERCGRVYQVGMIHVLSLAELLGRT